MKNEKIWSEKERMVISALRDKIKEWKDAGGLIIVKPTSANFKEMYFFRERIGISVDYVWNFVFLIQTFDDNKGDVSKKLFEIFKETSITLELFSFPFKRVKFSINGKNQEGNDKLLSFLKKENVMKLMKDSMTNEFEFKFYDLSNSTAYIKLDPLTICWLITAKKGPGDEWRFPAYLRKLFDTMNKISYELRNYIVSLGSM
ncbi:MAG: hypothetical protein QXS21_02020 [Thermoproteota archaeon]|nr:hypothetical protein [Candidatus Brockarchaeota archaeon]